MNTRITVNGLMNTGKATIKNTAIGPGSAVYQAPLNRPSETGCDIGVITVTPIETRSVRQTLELSPTKAGFHLGDRFAKVAAVQATSQGQGAAADAARRLVDRFAPKMLVLTGIGGAIDPELNLGDVVVATTVVCYDLSKETPAGVQYRGRSWEAPAESGRSINEFFAVRGEPAAFPGFVARAGIIGSGNTVIASSGSPVRDNLRKFNDKILAVDMESDGLGQFCHQAGTQGWAVVRGISDRADEQKNDDHQIIAAKNAAVVLRELIPYMVR
jgi:adenosylhomocysteine nucleosidase